MKPGQDQVDYIQLVGGMDTETSPLAVPPGRALDLYNFEPDVNGGYRRIHGYERFNGRAAPSDSVYYTMSISSPGNIAVGDTLTGGTSAATGKVIAIDGLTVVMTAVTGTFVSNETVGATVTTSAATLGGADDDTDDAAWGLLAENYYRDLIAALAGDGPVRGVWRLGTTVYAFRDDATNCKLYKSTTTGWSVIAYPKIVLFDGGTGAIAVGDTLTGATSAATGTVRRVVTYDGSTGTADAAGYVVLSGGSGTYQNNENLQVTGVTKALANGASYTHTQTEGGRYEFVNHNFYASSTTYRMYGCDGVNPAFEFDGTYFCPILLPNITGVPAANTPKYIEAHKGHLFLAFANGSLQHSVQGEPLTFDGFLAATEFGLGADITGLKSLTGGVLAAHTRRKTWGLYGNNAVDWTLDVIAERAGALDYSVQSLGQSYFVDDIGVTTLARVQAFGDFRANSLSNLVQTRMNEIRETIVASSVVRKSNQYRVHASDGTGILFYLNPRGQLEAGLFEYADAPVCIYNCEDEDGNEHIYFGDSAGMVYEAEVGNNFDGDEMDFLIRLPFNSLRAPRLRKSYRDVQFELTADRSLSLNITSEIDYGGTNNPSQAVSSAEIVASGGQWDVSNWDEFYWDAATIPSVIVPLTGTGNNISVIIYGTSATIRPWTLQGVILRYRVRRLDRG